MLRWMTASVEEAENVMRLRNRTDLKTMWVVVDGPEDGEATCMPIRDAIEGEFCYRWEAPPGRRAR